MISYFLNRANISSSILIEAHCRFFCFMFLHAVEHVAIHISTFTISPPRLSHTLAISGSIFFNSIYKLVRSPSTFLIFHLSSSVIWYQSSIAIWYQVCFDILQAILETIQWNFKLVLFSCLVLKKASLYKRASLTATLWSLDFKRFQNVVVRRFLWPTAATATI